MIKKTIGIGIIAVTVFTGCAQPNNVQKDENVTKCMCQIPKQYKDALVVLMKKVDTLEQKAGETNSTLGSQVNVLKEDSKK